MTTSGEAMTGEAIGAPAAPQPFLGPDGAATLALACAVAGLTLGASLLAALWHVLRVARATPAEAAAPAIGRVVVLGLRLPPGAAPCPAFRARLDRARALAEECQAAAPEVVVLGGVTRPGAPSEAEAGRRHLLAAGLDAARIGVEARSRHTLENLHNYRAAFGTGAAPDLLVTSRFHLARAGLMARGLGLPHALCAAEERFSAAPRALPRLLREAFLLHWYLVGRACARLAGRRGMLARIS